MKNKAGIWIDHRQAIIVFIDEGASVTDKIESGLEGHVRFTSHTSSEDGSADDQRDSQFTERLNRYYDEIILRVRDVEALLLFGPGEAKQEFKDRLSRNGYKGHIGGVETVDKMTEPQMVAKVRQHFHLNLSVPEAL